ncbi:hypothetical protein ES703_101328 [subsurface metagenome]
MLLHLEVELHVPPFEGYLPAFKPLDLLLMPPHRAPVRLEHTARRLDLGDHAIEDLLKLLNCFLLCLQLLLGLYALLSEGLDILFPSSYLVLRVGGPHLQHFVDEVRLDLDLRL